MSEPMAVDHIIVTPEAERDYKRLPGVEMKAEARRLLKLLGTLSPEGAGGNQFNMGDPDTALTLFVEVVDVFFVISAINVGPTAR